MKVIKKTGKNVSAWCLGDNSSMEQKLLASGKIRRTSDGRYELFSREAVSGEGELAETGDYFKLDSNGYPYPNSREWFEQNHRHLGGDRYIQIAKPLDAWEVGEPLSQEMEFLLKTGELIIHQENYEQYFEAFLWGARLTSPKDSVVVFYQVDRNGDGEIQEISFNFVNRSEFLITYDYCQ